MNKVVSLYQKRNMPEYGVKVWVHGCDSFGEWKVEATLKPYKGKPFKNAPPHRFVNKHREQVKYVGFWSEIEK